jgi:hypothetical protein
MRFSLRAVLLAALMATVMASTAGIAAGKNGPKPPHGNNPFAAEQQDASAPAAPVSAQGTTTQQGGCQIPGLGDPLQGTGNLVLNPNGATNFVCHGELPAGEPAPEVPVKVDLGDCDTILTPSGRARTICHSRP